MKRYLLASLLLATAARAAPAEKPMVMIHTGYLLDGDDKPVTVASQPMTFRIYDQNAPVNTETKIWEGTCSVPVNEGHYTAPLGGDCGTGLLPSMLPTDKARYLEVTVGETTLLPRMFVGTVPTAAVSSNALALQGQALADLDGRYAKFQADPSALVPQAGSLALDGTVSANALAAPTGNIGKVVADSVTAAQTVTTSGLSADHASVGQDLTAGSINSQGTIAATGALTVGGDTGLSGGLSVAKSATITGDVSSATAHVTGAIVAGSVAGDGSGLTNLNAANLATGTIPAARLTGTYGSQVSFTNSQNAFTGGFSGTFTGNGAALTNLNAQNLTGTVADARLSGNVARLDANNAFAGKNAFSNGITVGASGGASALTTGPAAYLDVLSNAASFVPAAYHRGNAGGIVFAGSQNADGSGWAYGSRLVNHDYQDGLALSFDVLSNGTWTNDVLVVSGHGAGNGVGNVGVGTNNPQTKLDVNGTANATNLTSANGIRTKNFGQIKVSRLAPGSSTATVPFDPAYMANHVGETFLWSADGPDLQDTYDCGANNAYRFFDPENGWKGQYIVTIEDGTKLDLQWSGWEGQLNYANGTNVTAGYGIVHATLSFESGFWKVQHMGGQVNQTPFSCW